MGKRFEFNEERMLSNLVEMIKIDSESGNEGEMTQWLMDWFTSRGFDAVRDNAGSTCGSSGDNVIVHIPGTMEGEAIAFNAHQDTVKPGVGIEPVIEGRRMYSKGGTILGADDKSGIAVLLEILENLKEKNIPHRELYYIFTIGEEVGMNGAKALDPAMLPCRSFFHLDDAADPGIVRPMGPGAVKMRCDFTGRAAHAGIEPEKGVSAVMMMGYAFTLMPMGRIDEETTSNIGVIGGGEATNIVAEHAWFTAEARSRNAEKLKKQTEDVRKACEEAAAKFGGKAEFTVEPTYPPYVPDENWFVIRCLMDAYEKEGIEPRYIPAGGGGDCNILCGKGYECTGISTGMYKCHTTDEYLELDELAACYRVVMRVMTDGYK
ncbi:MAG: M20/M25/M40 family metallo-hydrolase [Firmicutes bacterium]|nr:M20/M25/M40 family metallo-hydrolase [Bacillota bacterium]MBR0522478.1 M20/M25/M40 family metallo-hydrolase [Bacillota bacterium]